ncbi:hypothetical protein Y1Q_0015155 [Alligator mississippiensis]|uniref:Uncharacterized protein n=1 Tax=Alligator mississippiensis TaxID=8496 RepID=A0A151P8X6_ALLMI|nr:hypothetical protein Y1Q_0015155 [Alligator mississippiensis]
MSHKEEITCYRCNTHTLRMYSETSGQGDSEGLIPELALCETGVDSQWPGKCFSFLTLPLNNICDPCWEHPNSENPSRGCLPKPVKIPSGSHVPYTRHSLFIGT